MGITLKLKQLQTLILPPITNAQMASFMKHLTGNETFEADIEETLRTIMMYQLDHNLPKRSSLYGYLFTMDLDTLKNICSVGVEGKIESVIKSYSVGKIQIDAGGYMREPTIKTEIF